jgi:hypothetical protein
LSTEEKKALVADFEEVKAQNFHLHRDTPRARIQDVSNMVRNIKILVRIPLYFGQFETKASPLVVGALKARWD